MMKSFTRKKRLIYKITFIIICILIVMGLNFHYRNRRTYELNTPPIEKLTSIVIEQNAKGVIVSETEEMEDILKVLNGVKRITKEESVQDFPIDVSNEIKVDMNFENGTSTIFAYKEGNKCFIEQPYNGIYKISEEEYNWLEYFIIGEYKHNLQ